jgi:hypothetical protein
MLILSSGETMHNEINTLIHSMDVKQDREDAESKANSIFKFGEESLDLLVEMGSTVNEKDMDAIEKKRLLRAIIFTLLIFIKKNDTTSFKKIVRSKAKDLLFKLSFQGYESAKQVLYNLGFYTSDIQRELLLSLPIVEKHIRDKEISLSEAEAEIDVGKTYTGFKGIQDDHYMIGFDGKRIHSIYKIGRNLFGIRSAKAAKT